VLVWRLVVGRQIVEHGSGLPVKGGEWEERSGGASRFFGFEKERWRVSAPASFIASA
jgi:hypothetical protein